MAVKVHCSICDKFIKSVEQYDFQKLTGEEICEKCGKKVKKTYTELDDMVAEFKMELEANQKRMVKVTGAFQDIVKKYTNTIQSFYITRTAELDNRMKDILKGE